MPITVTWNDGVTQPTAFTITDEVVASLDTYRQSITVFNDEAKVFEVVYQSIQAMLVGIFMQNMVVPALALAPTAAVQTARDALAQAQADLATAQSAAIADFAPAP